MTKDQNDHPIHVNICQDEQGRWGANVWFGQYPPTNLSRRYYRTRAEARRADISHDIDKGGCIGFGDYLPVAADQWRSANWPNAYPGECHD